MRAQLQGRYPRTLPLAASVNRLARKNVVRTLMGVWRANKAVRVLSITRA
jgi:hypothetical protein